IVGSSMLKNVYVNDGSIVRIHWMPRCAYSDLSLPPSITRLTKSVGTYTKSSCFESKARKRGFDSSMMLISILPIAGTFQPCIAATIALSAGSELAGYGTSRYVGLASRNTLLPFFQSLRMYGPVPTG